MRDTVLVKLLTSTLSKMLLKLTSPLLICQYHINFVKALISLLNSAFLMHVSRVFYQLKPIFCRYQNISYLLIVANMKFHLMFENKIVWQMHSFFPLYFNYRKCSYKKVKVKVKSPSTLISAPSGGSEIYYLPPYTPFLPQQKKL